MDVMTALAAATQGLEVLRQLRDLDRSVNEAEWRSKIVEVQERLTDAKSALLEAKEAIAARDDEITRLKGALKRKEETIVVKGFPYQKGSDGTPRGRAFCSACIEKTGHFFRLSNVDHRYKCPSCKADYGMRVHVYPD